MYVVCFLYLLVRVVCEYGIWLLKWFYMFIMYSF